MSWLAVQLLVGGCGGGDGPPTGRPDAAGIGEGGTDPGRDGSARDGGPPSDDGGRGPDGGDGASGSVGPAAFCADCESSADCAEGLSCVATPTGTRCLERCADGCPAGFECQETSDVDGVDGSYCIPPDGPCCVDEDGDDYGRGAECAGPDCDDTDADVHPGATETCDGTDEDCSGASDDGDPSTMCPVGDDRVLRACMDGACVAAGCVDGFDDCDGDETNGCETSLTTVSDCGACGAPCSPPNASGDCSTGTCALGTCNDGFDDCDGDETNGCETSLTTVSDCGACGAPCSPPNASGDCSTGTCGVGTCSAGYGDCDRDVANGCETRLNTTTHCGACGRRCAPANGTGDCSSGSCRIVSCDDGYADCDRLAINGCETALSPPTCPGSSYGGRVPGDIWCSSSCALAPWSTFVYRTGRGEAWIRVQMTEDIWSDCNSSIENRITLDSPAGANYDLYVYRSWCARSGAITSSTRALGRDQVTVRKTNTPSDDSFTYYINVRHVSGNSCGYWTLRVEGHPSC